MTIFVVLSVGPQSCAESVSAVLRFAAANPAEHQRARHERPQTV